MPSAVWLFTMPWARFSDPRSNCDCNRRVGSRFLADSSLRLAHSTAHKKIVGGVSCRSLKQISCGASRSEAEHGVAQRYDRRPMSRAFERPRMVAPRYGSISATGNPVTVVTCLFEDLSRSCPISETPTAIRHRSTDIAADSHRLKFRSAGSPAPPRCAILSLEDKRPTRCE